MTVCQKLASPGAINCACAAAPSTISVVSDGLPISTPVSAATPPRIPAIRSKPKVTAALTATTAEMPRKYIPQSAMIARRSTLMPTVIRNTPSARPLNGAVMTSTSLW